MPHFPPILSPRVLFCGLLCAVTIGCAAPRTFVPDAKAKAKAHDRSQAAASTEKPTVPNIGDSSEQVTSRDASTEKPPATALPESEPDQPEPSVWSKWVGAFAPAKPKPKPRIPLPRTDIETEKTGF